MRMWPCVVFTTIVLPPLSAQAGELVIRNLSPSAVVCHADGYTIETGWDATWDIKIQPGESVRVEPSYKRKAPVIDWAECGNLKTRRMGITPRTPDGRVLLNGKQNRVLNVALYPDIPSHPNGNFDALLDHVVNAFQAAYPEVLLNAVVVDNDTKIYKFNLLPQQLNATGYDVLELDTLFMSYLVSSDLITPAKISGDAPLPVALAASTVNGVLYGVPSWLCMDFIFSYSSSLNTVHTLDDLIAFLKSNPGGRPALLADYNGSWRMPSIYINAYIQTYGYQSLSKAFVMPPDPVVVDHLKSLMLTCDSGSANSCVDKTNHNSSDGTIERVFANGNADAEIGFSEQSFYILLNQSVSKNLIVVPATWGASPQPLLYSDSFVTNKSSCSSDTCQNDSAAFTSMMTGLEMKKYIAFSQDLTPDMPPRHLLVATASFWNDDDVKNDPIYQQVAPIVRNAQPFPNSFLPDLQSEMDTRICGQLTKAMPNYSCN